MDECQNPENVGGYYDCVTNTWIDENTSFDYTRTIRKVFGTAFIKAQ